MEVYRFKENINGHDIFYVQSEPEFTKASAKKPVLVFLHPFAFDHYIWKYQWEAFKDEYSMLAIDLPGFGQSLLDASFEITPEFYQDVVSTLLERKEISSMILIGNSLGGAVALSLYPKLKKNIKGYFLMAPMTPDGLNLGFFKQIGLMLLKVPGSILFSKALAPILPSKQIIHIIFNISFETSISALLEHGFKEHLEVLYREPLATKNLLNVANILPNWTMLNKSLFALIEAPTVLLWGRNDKVLPCEAGVYLNESLPDSKLLVFNDIGHVPQIEHYEKTNLLLADFLKKL